MDAKFNVLELIILIVINIALVVGAIWRFTIRLERFMTRTDNKLSAMKEDIENNKTDIDQAKENFNHRFTEYKNHVLTQVKEVNKQNNDAHMQLMTRLESMETKVLKSMKEIAYMQGHQAAKKT